MNKPAEEKMIYIEFLKDFGCCWKKGDVGHRISSFANSMIEHGIAKRVEKPKKNKMVESPEMAKGI